jgi:hypothetical protein
LRRPSHRPRFGPGVVAAASCPAVVVSFFRPALRAAVFVLLVVLGCGAAGFADVPQLVNPEQLIFYRNVDSYVDQSTAKLIGSIPELKDLQPAASEQQDKKTLATLQLRVGRSVQQFYTNFRDVTSIEHIALERIGPRGKVEASRSEEFRYLVISHTGQGGRTLEEYRTNMAGSPTQPTGLAQGFVITKGFVSLPVYLLPEHQSESRFRFLGTEKMGGRTTDVIAFAQRPGWARVPIYFNMRGHIALLLVQGIAWIDPSSDQIVQLRVDMLAPRPDVGLLGFTVEVTFGKVQFPEMPPVWMWLPKVVMVTIRWESMARVDHPRPLFQRHRKTGHWDAITYRNIHRYTDYKLFASKSKLKY